MKVIVTERIAEEGIELLRQEFEVDTKFGVSHDELVGIIENYDAIVVRSVTQVNAELVAKGNNLKVAGRAGNGIDNIDVEACTNKGIIVVNTPDSNTMAAAELTIGHIFSVFRNIPQAHMAAKNKDFRRNKFKGAELNEKVAGVIGLGRIGSLVAERLKGCNMRLIAYDPYISDERFARFNAEKCETLEELLTQSDVITVHTPKTEETYGMIGEKELKLCKKGVRIVNVARGGIINEKALLAALKEGWVAAAGIDVFEHEPNYEAKPGEHVYENPLLELDNMIATPHLGASTLEAQYNVGVTVAKQVISALKGEMVSNAVNMPSMPTRELKDLKAFLELAEKLGKIYYQTEKEQVEKIEVIYSGEIGEKPTGVITLAVLKGFLEPVVKEKVNYVNAELLARTRGIKVVESRVSNVDRYQSVITVNFKTRDRQLSVAGTVLGKEDIRILDFFGYHVDIEPTTFMLVVQNTDKPGVIGRICTALGNNGINIASMQASRNKKGEKQVMFVSVDAEVCEDTLQAIRQVDGVLKATMIRY